MILCWLPGIYMYGYGYKLLDFKISTVTYIHSNSNKLAMYCIPFNSKFIIWANNTMKYEYCINFTFYFLFCILLFVSTILTSKSVWFLCFAWFQCWATVELSCWLPLRCHWASCSRASRLTSLEQNKTSLMVKQIIQTSYIDITQMNRVYSKNTTICQSGRQIVVVYGWH